MRKVVNFQQYHQTITETKQTLFYNRVMGTIIGPLKQFSCLVSLANSSKLSKKNLKNTNLFQIYSILNIKKIEKENFK